MAKGGGYRPRRRRTGGISEEQLDKLITKRVNKKLSEEQQRLAKQRKEQKVKAVSQPASKAKQESVVSDLKGADPDAMRNRRTKLVKDLETVDKLTQEHFAKFAKTVTTSTEDHPVMKSALDAVSSAVVKGELPTYVRNVVPTIILGPNDQYHAGFDILLAVPTDKVVKSGMYGANYSYAKPKFTGLKMPVAVTGAAVIPALSAARGASEPTQEVREGTFIHWVCGCDAAYRGVAGVYREASSNGEVLSNIDEKLVQNFNEPPIRPKTVHRSTGWGGSSMSTSYIT